MWIHGGEQPAPMMWIIEWPEGIKDCLVTEKKRGGDITNSDLEMTDDSICTRTFGARRKRPIVMDACKNVQKQLYHNSMTYVMDI